MSNFSIFLLLGAGCCVPGIVFLLYTAYIAYMHRKYSGILSPTRPSFFLGHLPDMWRVRKETGKEDPLFRLINYWLQGANSETFVVFFFHSPMVVTVDPTFIKTIYGDQRNTKTSRYQKVFPYMFGTRFMKEALLVIQDYNQWKPMRELYNPGFRLQFLSTIVPSLNKSVNPTLDKLMSLADNTTKVPMGQHIKKLTLDVFNQGLYSTDFSSVWTADSVGVTLPQGSDVDLTIYIIDVYMEGLMKSVEALVPTIYKLLHPTEVRKYRTCVSALRTMGRECFKKRMKMIKNKEELPRDGLTEMLLANREGFNIDNFLDQFVNWYTLGYNPVADTVQFMFILLHQHPNALERVLQEIEEVVGNRTEITNEDLEAMKYLEKVFYETVRLYYVAPGTTRNLHAATMVGKYRIPADSYILIAETNSFHMAKYFKDPDKFIPDRFDNEPIPSLTYYPFGQGPRSCIGKYLSLMLPKIVLVRLLQKFKFNFPQDYEIYAMRDPKVRPRDEYVCTLQLNKNW